MSKFLKTIEIPSKGGSYHSFNRDYHLVDSSTKVIIVGTITSPQGRVYNRNFYYMSPYNPMYRILDKYFASIDEESNFVDNKKIGNIAELIKELKEKKIAFLDVIQSCNNFNNSSLDDNLTDIRLDYEAFKGIDKNIVLIANSNNAYQALLKIADKNHLKNEIKLVYGFRFYKQEEWNTALNLYLCK